MIPLAGTRGFAKAQVTAGGVPLAEVELADRSRVRSCRACSSPVELLDLDGPIGGFNFQAAFSTGWLAGLSV